MAAAGRPQSPPRRRSGQGTRQGAGAGQGAHGRARTGADGRALGSVYAAFAPGQPAGQDDQQGRAGNAASLHVAPATDSARSTPRCGRRCRSVAGRAAGRRKGRPSRSAMPVRSRSATTSGKRHRRARAPRGGLRLAGRWCWSGIEDHRGSCPEAWCRSDIRGRVGPSLLN